LAEHELILDGSARCRLAVGPVADGYGTLGDRVGQFAPPVAEFIEPFK
jgi:hypothetical protein